jgi:hypothetical protein
MDLATIRTTLVTNFMYIYCEKSDLWEDLGEKAK